MEFGYTVRIGQLRQLLVRLRKGKIKAPPSDELLGGTVVKPSRLLGVPSPQQKLVTIDGGNGSKLDLALPLIPRGLGTRTTLYVLAGVIPGGTVTPLQKQEANLALTRLLEDIHLQYGSLDLLVSLLYSTRPPDMTPYTGLLETKGRQYQEEGSKQHQKLVEMFQSARELNAQGSQAGAKVYRIIALHGLVPAAWKGFAPFDTIPGDVFTDVALVKIARVLTTRLQQMGISGARLLDAQETTELLFNGLDPVSAPFVYQELDEGRRNGKKPDLAASPAARLGLMPQAWQESPSGFLQIGRTLTAVLLTSQVPGISEVGAMAELRQLGLPFFDLAMTYRLSKRRREKRHIENEASHEGILKDLREGRLEMEDLEGHDRVQAAMLQRRQLHRSRGPATRGTLMVAINHHNAEMLTELAFFARHALLAADIQADVIPGSIRTAAARLQAYGLPQPKLL
ncbi:MAG: DUF1471 domain-containing protein [Candidatus Saccharimonadales bacterium]|nr:DUF1471 domain-containing protein [Candidatus Saccharimonadales bacterium]